MRTTHLSDLNATLRRSFADVVDAAEDLLRTTANDADGEWKRARRSLETSVSAAKERIAEHALDFSSGTRSVARRADRLVRSSPWSSAGAGVALGVLAGVLFCALKRDDR